MVLDNGCYVESREGSFDAGIHWDLEGKNEMMILNMWRPGGLMHSLPQTPRPKLSNTELETRSFHFIEATRDEY